MKILMVISQFHPAIVGGTEKQALSLSRTLVDSGAEVRVLTQRTQGLPANELISGIKVDREIRTLRFGFLYGITYILSSLFYFVRNRRRYDIIHCHHLYLCAAAAVITAGLFSKKVAVKIACTGEYSDIRCMRNMRGGPLLLWIAKKADIFFAISDETVKELLETGINDNKIITSPNFVDTAVFMPAADEVKKELKIRLNLPLNGPIVISCGRLVRQKGPEFLLQAWHMAKMEGLPGHLIMLGDGILKKELEEKIKALGLSESVTLRGDRQDVPDFLRAADIFVLASLAEGMSNALLEAMSSGLACIATKIGGNTDLIRHNADGILVSPASPEEIHAGLKTLLLNPMRARGFGESMALKIKQHYSLDRVTSEYLKLYERL